MQIVPYNLTMPQRPQSASPIIGGAPAYAPRAPQMSDKEIAALTRIKEAASQAKTALSGMQNSTAELREAKKQDALRRFEALSKRMMALKKAFGGDPKFLAKTLNAIAKELKSVVKDYKDAIGDTPGLTPNIQSQGIQQAQLAQDQAANIEKSTPSNEQEIKSETDATQPDLEPNLSKEIAAQSDTPIKDEPSPSSGQNEIKGETKPPNDAIRAYATSLLIDEHGKFMRGVRKMVEEIKQYSNLFKAQIRFGANDKEGEEIIQEGDDAIKELVDEVSALQDKLSSPNMAVGNLVSVTA